ncbi:tetratricopeptide repeat protein [Evtepia gabavorous]|uniref:tetratricopeptide repeat protein n=1 Tax=Evtepia gabavorous TaxID=2211183 RepID=UPI003A955B64
MKKMIVSLAVFLFCAVFLLSGCDKEPTWQEFYDAGIQASEEENYEEAIVAFEEAIALDASRPEAYAALADVYLAKEDLEQALEVLQRGVEATNDETLKARVEEITVKLEELAEPQKPEYMVEYLGMTVNEIAALWGEDYTVAPDLYLGGSKGIYYEDSRIPATFYFQDIFNNGVQTGKERIDLIEISSDLTIAEGFFPALTRPELESTHPEGEFAFFEESGNGATYTCKYNDNISIIYGWEYGDDPEITPAPWITLYMEGLDNQDTQDTQMSWKDVYRVELERSLRSVSNPSMCRYYVYDINGDGTPELLEGIGKGRADYTIHVYTAKEGSLQKLGEMFGDDIGVFGNQNILFGYYAQMGYETVTIYSVSGENVAKEERYVKESPEGYMDFNFLDSFSLEDLSGLDWTGNPSGGNNQDLMNRFMEMGIRE